MAGPRYSSSDPTSWSKDAKTTPPRTATFSFVNPGNDTAANVPKFAEVNGRIDLTGDGRRFNLALVGKNLLNDRFITSMFVLQGLGGYRYIFYNRPRTVAVEATFNF